MTDSEKKYFSDMYERHAKSVYGVCLLYLKNKDDAQEAVSEAFVRLMRLRPAFADDAHAKAYLMRTAVNVCKNLLASWWHRRAVYDQDVLAYLTAPQERSILAEVLSLPPKYRVILYMHYYLGYTAKEIANATGLTQSAVLSRLSRGRKRLKAILIEGGFNYA